MKLNKRNCPINIELDPCGVDLLDVAMDICGKHYDFTASSVMGDQFDAFLYALYGMYFEASGERRFFKNGSTIIEYAPVEKIISARIYWDSEGHIAIFDLKRKFSGFSVPADHEEDFIELTIDERDTFVVDARDLCYAVAKAMTEAMKKYGIYGYHLTCGANCNGFGDYIDIDRLLFVKAYALRAMEARETTDLYLHPAYPDRPCWRTFSSFEKELELLLFDM